MKPLLSCLFGRLQCKFDCYTTMTIAFMVLILCLSFVIELPEFTKTFPGHDGWRGLETNQADFAN